MRHVEFTSAAARERYDVFVAAASQAVVGLDMDGTLAPIVDDPTQAYIHPDAPAALIGLAPYVRALAVVTGRPARQALSLGQLDEVGDALSALGRELFVFGHYGNERWSSAARRIVSPRPPHGLASFEADIGSVLRRAEATDAFVEDKGLAVAIHTRRLADPQGTLDRLVGPVSDLARNHGLAVEPGRAVIEVRAPGMDKGDVLRSLVAEVGAEAICFGGDDLGDLEAYAAVEEFRAQGMPTLLVCSASDEESALRDRADVVVPGPPGVVALLRQLTQDAATH